VSHDPSEIINMLIFCGETLLLTLKTVCRNECIFSWFFDEL